MSQTNRLYDWLAVFGFGLGPNFPGFSCLIPRQRNNSLGLVGPMTYTHGFRGLPKGSKEDRCHRSLHTGTVRWGSAEPRRVRELLTLNKRRFSLCQRSAKEDVHALPHLAPGSIVRVDERRSKELLPDGKNNAEGRIFLLSTASVSSCSLTTWCSKKARIMLHSPQRSLRTTWS